MADDILTYPKTTHQNSRFAEFCRSFPYSHSIVPGGFHVTSYTTRLMPRTSLMMRVAHAAEQFVGEREIIRRHAVGRASRRAARSTWS